VAEELDDDVHDIPVDTAVLLSIANGYLDAFTYVGHGGVFANAQSGNVILLGAELAHPGSHRSLDHLWPLLAFIVGVLVARRIGLHTMGHHRWRDPRPIVLLAQVVILAFVALLPNDAPDWTITTSVGFAAALQISSFRTVRSSKYVPIAMTGNLMRTTEAFDDVIHHKAERQQALLYVLLIASFLGGALSGALATEHLTKAAALVPAVLLLLGGAVLYQRAGRRLRTA
jgi:uncharacterized membrane protein YoaK (UPF0700 family)